MVTTSPDGDHESPLLRERVRAVEPDEAGPDDSAAPHESSSALLDEDYLISAAWTYRLQQAPSRSELLLKRPRDGGERLCDQDGVVRSVLA